MGTDAYVWDYEARKVIREVRLGRGTGALEVRWRSDPKSTVGYTNAPGTNEIWAWEDLDGDGHFKVVIKMPNASVSTDMLLTHDDKYMYVDVNR